jgi:hypothetical protein
MNAVELLAALRAHGVQLAVVGGRLLLKGKGPKPQVLLDTARAKATEIARLLQAEQRTANAQAQGADGGGEAGAERPTWWPSWAQEYYERLQRAGCSPKIVVARGNGGQPTSAVESSCPGCGWAGGLVAWPLSTGTMAFRCRAGCNQKEIAAGLEQRLKQRN